MFKPCIKCDGSGFQAKIANQEENPEGTEKEKDEKIPCEACSGSGYAILHMTNLFNKQLSASISIQNQTLTDIRKKTYEIFNNLKKHD